MSKSTIFQLCGDGSSWVELELSKDKCSRTQHNDSGEAGTWGSSVRSPSTLPLSHCDPCRKPATLFKLYYTNRNCICTVYSNLAAGRKSLQRKKAE